MNHQLLRFAPVAIAAALALTACNRQETPAPKTAAPAPAPARARQSGRRFGRRQDWPCRPDLGRHCAPG